jgi:hypothetical protein
LRTPPERTGAAGGTASSLLEFMLCMADWKQITARIRRARTGKDPAGQLANLFSKTRDAMVAFELARYFESIGNTADAGRWYLTAAERFRRADWKTKAQESATRLGATEPAEIPAPLPRIQKKEEAVAETATESLPNELLGAVPTGADRHIETPASSPRREQSSPATGRPRRGRRGGRDSRSSRPFSGHAAPRGEAPARTSSSRTSADAHLPRAAESDLPEAALEVPVAPSLRGRSGDPGLSSRLSQLEMNFRRLLGSTPTPLDAAEKAPAGPGVFVLTDSDLTTYYYVEPCQTLRVAIPNLLRGGANRKGEMIRPRLAEHLGIPESRVAKYLGDHCVVRWLQMDEDAAHFAHFLIAVLRPALNE